MKIGPILRHFQRAMTNLFDATQYLLARDFMSAKLACRMASESAKRMSEEIERQEEQEKRNRR